MTWNKKGDILKNALVTLFHANVAIGKKYAESIIKEVYMTHTLYVKFSEQKQVKFTLLTSALQCLFLGCL